jgi:hypothetical protein
VILHGPSAELPRFRKTNPCLSRPPGDEPIGNADKSVLHGDAIVPPHR